jgi:hypothetical protein
VSSGRGKIVPVGSTLGRDLIRKSAEIKSHQEGESRILANIPIAVYKVHDGSRDYVMSRHKSRVVRFLLYALACVLISAAFASELPEQLTLKNDTSNDYSFRPSTSLKSIQTLNSLRQDSSFFVTTAPQHTSWRTLLSVPGRASLQVESLFILHSVLRT